MLIYVIRMKRLNSFKLLSDLIVPNEYQLDHNHNIEN